MNDRISPTEGTKPASIMKRMLHGTGAGVAAHALGIGSNLLLLPLYLRTWSVPLYGEWMALYAVVNYLGNLDFGITTAAINAATIAYAGKDWAVFKRIQGTAWAASLAVAAAGLIAIGGMCLFYFRVNQWLGFKVLDYADSRFIFFALSASLLISIPSAQLIAVYTATGRFAKYQWLYNAYNLLVCAAIAIALGLGAGPKILSIVILGTTLSTALCSLCLLYRNGALLLPRLRDLLNGERFVQLAAPTGQFGLSMIATALTVQGPIVVLSRVLGGPAVAIFTTSRTVTNAVRATLVLLRAPLRPEIGAASARDDKSGLRRLFRIAGSDSCSNSAISLSGSSLVYGGAWLIRFWSHGEIVQTTVAASRCCDDIRFCGFSR